jgi:hypothetical protein
MSPQEAKIILENEMPGIVERIMNAKKQFDNHAILNVFESKDVINETSRSLALYAYQVEAIIIKQSIIDMGLLEVAEDFYYSAASPENMKSIIKENTDSVQSHCKLFGKKVDAVFQEICDYSNKYLLFLAEDAQGAKQYVPQTYLATKGTVFSTTHPWRHLNN